MHISKQKKKEVAFATSFRVSFYLGADSSRAR